MERTTPDEASVRDELIVITPARDEAVHMKDLIRCLRSQTRPPDAWVIVDDGSKDGTGDIARRESTDLGWVTVIDSGSTTGRSFGSKAAAVRAGVDAALGPATGVIINLDADVRPPADYLARVMEAFAADDRLGVFGGVYTYRSRNGVRPEIGPANHVPGGVQAFRREVFDQIGGYGQFPYGGEDVAASVMAEMRGWTVRHDAGLVCEHIRATGTAAGRSRLRAQFFFGRQDYDLGTAPWFAVVKAANVALSPPVLVGAVARLCGYGRGAVSRRRTVTLEFQRFIRRRQQDRFATRLLQFRKP